MDIRTRRLREEFEKSGMTQSELCEKTGINKGALSSYLSGRYFPKQKALEKLSKIFDVSIQYLMGISDNKNEESDTYYTNEKTAEIAQEIYEDKDMRVLFDAAKGAKPDDLKMAADLLKRLKGTNDDG